MSCRPPQAPDNERLDCIHASEGDVKDPRRQACYLERQIDESNHEARNEAVEKNLEHGSGMARAWPEVASRC